MTPARPSRSVALRLGPWLLISIVATAMPAAHAQNVWVLKNAPDAQTTSPTIVNYSSISNFRTNTGSSNTIRASGQGQSCDISIDSASGVVYYLAGSATSTDNKQLYSWPSLSNWAANSNITPYGERTNYGPVRGMSVYNNQLYVLEGNPVTAGNASLRSWSSFSSFVNGDAGTLVGTRLVGEGLGFEIGIDGSVYKLDSKAPSSDPYTATEGILYSWPTINNFLADTNVSNNGGQFTYFVGSPDQIAGISVAPEPSGMMLAGLGLAAFAGATWRRRRSAQPSPVGTLTNS